MGYALAGIGVNLTRIGGLHMYAEKEEVDFFIHKLLKMPFQFMGQDVYLTTSHVCMLIIFAVIIGFAIVARHKIMHADEVPGTFQNVVELLVETLVNFVGGTMGENAKKYVNYIGTIFLYIFLCNISGLFGLRPPTADYATTLTLAIITVSMVWYANIKTNKFGVITNLFKPIPILFPSNLIGEFSSVVSLSLRLFGNILAGTVMIALFYNLLPTAVTIGIPTFLHAYLDLFSGAIQAFVFSMLTMVFISDKLEN